MSGAPGGTFSDALQLVRSVAAPTPLEEAPGLISGRNVWLKREDLGINGSFKWRGALCACSEFRVEGAAGVVTASTGNHGAAVAWAAAKLGMTAHVVVPVGANERKRAHIVEAGARLLEGGRDLDEASEFARELARELALPYFEDGRHPAQIAGVSTIGLELAGVEADAVVVPLACGALAAGVATGLAMSQRAPAVIGVQSVAFARFSALFHTRPDPLRPTGTTIADGLAENRIVEPAFSICRERLADIVAVDDPALIAAGRALRRQCDAIVEPAAAAPLACLREHATTVPGRRVVLVLSGGNADSVYLDDVLKDEPGDD